MKDDNPLETARDLISDAQAWVRAWDILNAGWAHPSIADDLVDQLDRLWFRLWDVQDDEEHRFGKPLWADLLLDD